MNRFLTVYNYSTIFSWLHSWLHNSHIIYFFFLCIPKTCSDLHWSRWLIHTSEQYQCH